MSIQLLATAVFTCDECGTSANGTAAIEVNHKGTLKLEAGDIYALTYPEGWSEGECPKCVTKVGDNYGRAVLADIREVAAERERRQAEQAKRNDQAAKAMAQTRQVAGSDVAGILAPCQHCGAPALVMCDPQTCPRFSASGEL